MVMDMLEHETADHAPGALAARAHSTIFTIGTSTNVLNRTFLLKKMEIEFTWFSATPTDDANAIFGEFGYLLLQNTTSGTDADSPAESFDAALADREKHNTIIWTRNFLAQPSLFDDTDNISFPGNLVSFKTSKSFPKGFPLDKDENYSWRLFNQSTASPWTTGGVANLRVRYWGVYL